MYNKAEADIVFFLIKIRLKLINLYAKNIEYRTYIFKAYFGSVRYCINLK